ncbi:MAG: AAA family ATPase, partial [Cyanobacteria bacterium J06642_11]
MSTSPSSNPRFAFYNQDHAFNRVRNSLGELVVLDTLPGCGKTAFLNKLKTEYKTQQWQCSLIPLKRARNEMDTVTAAIESISDRPIEAPDSLAQALHSLLEQLQPGQPQALMFDDVQCLGTQALDWVKRKLARDLQRELKDLTDNKFLLIFSGHSIRGTTPWPMGSR